MQMLIVEDDRALATVLQRHFEAAGYEVETAGDGESGLARTRETRFDLALIDLNLPGVDGTEVLSAIRRSGESTAVIVLSGRSGLEERLQCFTLGADDYLVKPFALRELALRVKALGRRAKAAPPVLRCADLELDPQQRSVVRSGKKIDLSAREYALAEYLVQHKGRCVPRATLLKQVWGMPEESGTNVVEVYVNYLRRKVDQGFAKPLIHTVRGEGYVIREISAGLRPSQRADAAIEWGRTKESVYPFPRDRTA